jgi:hypothetical protein
MRIRSYYSDSEIIPNLYTFGNEWQLTDGSEYKGLYHKYKSTGEIYTEAVWNQRSSVSLSEYKELPASVKLYRKLKSDIQIGTATINPLVAYTPTPQEYSVGYITRYFLKKCNEDLIYEVDVTQYTNQLTSVIDSHLYISAAITWFITGETVDVTTNNVKTRGVISKNRQSIRNTENQMPGITRLLKNLLQYYTDTDYVVPRDINKN